MLDLATKSELKWLAALVHDMNTVVPGIDLLLVGATARDVLLSYAHGITLLRATHDVNLAFAVADWSELLSLNSA